MKRVRSSDSFYRRQLLRNRSRYSRTAIAANSPAVTLAGKLSRFMSRAAASSSALSSGSIRIPSITFAAPVRRWLNNAQKIPCFRFLREVCLTLVMKF